MKFFSFCGDVICWAALKVVCAYFTLWLWRSFCQALQGKACQVLGATTFAELPLKAKGLVIFANATTVCFVIVVTFFFYIEWKKRSKN